MTQSSHLLGYNNNVRHRGQIFHIQTEDSGVNSPRINTHLFADGGRIVRSTRVDYTEQLQEPDLKVWVKAKMKEQHKKMFVALRSGSLDEVLGFAPDLSISKESKESLIPLSSEKQIPVVQGSSSPPQAAEFIRSEPSQSARLKKPSLRVKQDLAGGRPTLSDEILPLALGTANRLSQKNTAQMLPKKELERGEEVQLSATQASTGRRPTSAQGSSTQGLFGEKEGQEASLDDAILSYLSEKKTPAKP